MITKPLLAETLKDPAALQFPVLATPKLDGIRALKVNGNLVSRSFKPIQNAYIRTALERLLPDGADGEIMSGSTFQECSGNVMRRDGTPSFTYYWFDYVNESLEVPYHIRMGRLESWLDFPSQRDFMDTVFQEEGIRVVALLPTLINSVEELNAFEAKCLSEGYEGVMLRKPDGRYKCGRSSLKEGILLKLKQFEDGEAVVLDTYELMHNTNEAEKDELGHTKRSSAKEGLVPTGKIGGFSVKGLGGKWDGVLFDIGTFNGVTHEQREQLWRDRASLPGKILKYVHFPQGCKDAPRFPIFHGWRHTDDMG